jgi:hypothetical protein
MAATKQVAAAKRNVQKAVSAARAQRTISKLPKATRTELGRQGAKARARSRGKLSGHPLENRTRQELYDAARRKGIPGRSKMGKWDLIRALRKAG